MDGIDAKKQDPIAGVKFQVKRRPKEVVAPEHLLRQLRAYEDSARAAFNEVWFLAI
jgi:hypothetical protein